MLIMHERGLFTYNPTHKPSWSASFRFSSFSVPNIDAASSQGLHVVEQDFQILSTLSLLAMPELHHAGT